MIVCAANPRYQKLDIGNILFNDPMAYIFEDELHSVAERREIIIGHQNNRLLLVCFTERKRNIIRIISAPLRRFYTKLHSLY